MKSEKFLDRLDADGHKVINIQEAAAILDVGKSYASLYLQRLVKQGRLYRVFKGMYATPKATIWEIASSISRPSYITGIAALHINGIINQFPNEISVFNAEYSRRFGLNIPDGKYTIRLIKVKPFRIFGYSSEGGYANVATPEKAIIDSFYAQNIMLYEYVKDAISELVGGDNGKDAVNTLIEYAKRMKSKVLLKRLGYTLDKLGIDTKGTLKPLISDKYEPLFPEQAKDSAKSNNKPSVDRKWAIVIDE